MTSMQAWCGRTLGGRYHLEQIVGEGGFGVVFRARHLVLDAPVAIKALRPERLTGELRERLVAATVAEAQLLARLRHPAIVAVLDGGYEDDPVLGVVPWFAMEWCEGETLEDELARRRGRGGRSIHEALALLRPVLEGVAHGHAQGIAHRDLKPANVVLVRTPAGPAARVLDFGLAKKLGHDEHLPLSGATQTASADRAYTPAYATPEQLAGGRTGPWTDVFALGLLITEVLIDRPCYDADTFYATAVDPVRPTPRRFGVDVGPWEAPLARALAVHPAARFASAGELLAALVAAVGATPGGPPAAATASTMLAGPSSPVAPAVSAAASGPVASPPPARTSALAVVATLLGLCALAGVAGLGWILWTAEAEPPVAAAAPASRGAGLRALTVDELKRLVIARGFTVVRANTTSAATFEMTILEVDDGASFGGVTLYVMKPGISTHEIVASASKAPGVALAQDANVLLQVGLYGKTGGAVDPGALLRHVLASYPGAIIPTAAAR